MIVVTGGAGFIGSNIIHALNNIGRNDILVVDDLKNGAKFTNLVDLNILDYLDKGDFFTKIMAGYSFGGIDVIFHEGACSSTIEWNGKYMMNNNYKYSKELLHYCIKRDIAFLYASSAAIYGGYNNYFIEEKQHERPLNIYGYSKFLFDQYVRKILPQTTSQVCGFRYFNVYGPRESHKGNMASIIFRLNSQICQGQKPKLFIGSEKIKRDFIHVSDVVAVNLWCWQNKISGIFNCGTGKANSFQDVANTVISFHQGKNILVEYIDFPNELKFCYQLFTKADLKKLRTTGYNKEFKTIVEGVSDYMHWLNHKNQIGNTVV